MKSILSVLVFLLPILIMGQEICDDGIDNDQDGLVDLFDPDCDCDVQAYQAQCPVECEIIPDSFPSFEMVKKWETIHLQDLIRNDENIVCGDIDGDGDVEILSYTYADDNPGIAIFNGSTGDLERKINISCLASQTSFISIADIDNDGYAEIFIPIIQEFTFTKILCYDYVGLLLWESDDLMPFLKDIQSTSYISNITDFNGDGHSEIYMGSVILNAESGIILAYGEEGIGCNAYNASFCYNMATVAADLLPSSGLELAAGNTVYEVRLNNLNGLTGNMMIPHIAVPEVFDGFTGIADIDGDEELDVVSISEEYNGFLTVWNPRTLQLIARAPSADGGGLPFIGDVDNDCIPEIGVTFRNELRLYRYNQTTDLDLVYSRSTTDGSGVNSATMFDFNQDGLSEIIHRDGTNLKIYEGFSGLVLDSIAVSSTTALEFPIVADIDLDGAAELLVVGNGHRVNCFESASDQWAPARSVWNQVAYNPTMINDDLTVPRNPQKASTPLQGTENCEQETCSTPYNNFMVQATYRTQEGCLVWPEENECNEEICGDGIDNDNDGLIDLFDPDCPCDDLAYQAQCEPECEIIPDNFPVFNMIEKWESIRLQDEIRNDENIVCGDIDNDGDIEILSYTWVDDEPGIAILNATTGALERKIDIIYQASQTSFISIADIDGDGYAEIFIPIHKNFTSTKMLCYSYQGSLLWESEELIPYLKDIQGASYISNVADFNSDGISEVYIGSVILNAETGVLLTYGQEGLGCNAYNSSFCSNMATVAADLLPTPGLELAAGNTVYEITLNNLSGLVGNTMIPHLAVPEVFDGFTGIVDIDNDGELDVVSIAEEYQGFITVWNPRTLQLIAKAPSGEGGGLPVIGDVDGDCIPEIGVTFRSEFRLYKYNQTTELELLYSKPTSDLSGLTGATMFDFNQDGFSEIVYRDSHFMRIYDGITGGVLDSVPMGSTTGHEFPIIADIDQDGAAELLVVGNGHRVGCYESASDPWAPARSVWNQVAYNPTMINDDLTVPRYPQKASIPLQGTENCEKETCSTPYNNFMVQATYRTQEGCLVWPDVDCFSQEICDDGTDNDQDGLIDLFDPDCDCDEQAYQAQCPIECEIILDSFPSFEMVKKWETIRLQDLIRDDENIVCGDIDGDGEVEILSYTYVDDNPGIAIFDAITGVLERKIDITCSASQTSFISIADIDNDGYAEIFVPIFQQFTFTKILCYDYLGTFLWESVDLMPFLKDIQSTSYISNIADFNGDGHSEIYMGSVILNAESGIILAYGEEGVGCNAYNSSFCYNMATVAADLLPSSGLELAAGNTIYEIILNNRDGIIGNMMIPHIAVPEVFDGFTGIADIDGDGHLDVVSISEEYNGFLTVWNPRTLQLIARAPSADGGGLPFIGDVDGDCIPEIGVTFRNELRLYRYNQTTDLDLVYSRSTTDNSGVNSATMFDFNQDGFTEIIHRDQTNLKIYEGFSGLILDSIAVSSTTSLEFPIVADVDLDGAAELLVVGNGHRVNCYESANTPWAPARSVWNQVAYNPTMINDDLTVPRYPQKASIPLQGTENCEQETCSTPYNNFMVQATYRTQEGCLVWPDVDCFSQEICDDGTDNDQDGLIDLFDPDCDCDVQAYQAQCPVECEIIPDSFPSFEMVKKWETIRLQDLIRDDENIVCGDIDGDGEVEILSYTYVDDNPGIAIFDAITGVLEFKFDISCHASQTSFISIADINNDGFAEIFIPIIQDFTFSKILCYDHQGTFLWESVDIMPFLKNIQGTSYISNIADFNGDGISEVYMGSVILNAQTGVVLAYGEEGIGCNAYNSSFCNNMATVAADLLPNTGLELAAGNTVYEVKLNNLNGTSGNTMVPHIAVIEVFDGLTGVVDIDGDGELDVVSISDEYNGFLTVWNPRTLQLIARAPSADGGGLPFIGDVDGDCVPEIGVTFKNELRLYRYNQTSDLDLVYSRPTSDNSGVNSATMFDFNQDGFNEIIHRDQTNLKIYEGYSGLVLDSITVGSTTGLEFPIVADVDLDGAAELLVVGNGHRVNCYESANTPWAPARSVWNQVAYNPTMINDDLTVPRYPQKASIPLQGSENCEQETCSTPYNNFMVQATYRTQEGCLVWPARNEDFQITTDYQCDGDSVKIYIFISSVETLTQIDSLPLSVWTYPTLDNDIPFIQTFAVSDSSCFTVKIPDDADSLLLIVNNLDQEYPPNLPNTNIHECNYANNTSVLSVKRPILVGIDQSICANDSFFFYDQFLSEAGNYIYSKDECDTIFNLNLSINPTNIFSTSVSLCQGDSIWFNGDFIFTEGIYSNDTINAYGCDSTVLLDLTVNDIYLSNIDTFICSGDSVLFQGMNYAEQGFYEISSTSLTGCDSTISLNIEFYDSYIDTSEVSICAGDSLMFNGDYIYTSNYYTASYNSIFGCDSTIVLDLLVKDEIVNIIDTIICFGESVLINGDSFTEPDSYIFNLIAADGCDSTIFLNLSNIPSIQDTTTLAICEGDSILFDGVYVYDEDLYSAFYTSALGCDSSITLDLIIEDVLTETIDTTICPGDSIMVSGVSYGEVDVYEIALTSMSGCDSILTLDITHYPIYRDTIYTSICSGDSTLISDEYYQSEGVFDIYLSSINGCDSIIVLDVTVDTTVLYSASELICDGDSIMLLGDWRYAAGEYIDTAQAVSGCDSISYFTLTVLDILRDTSVIEICNGDSVIVHNQNVYESGLYSESYTSSNGCDSISNVSVILVDLFTDTLHEQICFGDSTFFDSWITESGIYSTEYTSTSGCDSVVTLELSYYDEIDIPDLQDIQIVTDEIFVIDLESTNNTYSYYWSPSSSVDCDTCITVEINVAEPTEIELEIESAEGCIAYTSFTAYPAEENVLDIPNIFSPNGDGINDIWSVDLSEYTGVTLYVFDRWGNLISTSNDKSEVNWDGSYNGNDAIVGVYVYSLHYTDQNNNVIQRYGDITLVR